MKTIVSTLADQHAVTVAITGFGPFQCCTNNPSERIVRRIDSEGLKDILPNARVISRVIPVAYDDVQHTVCELWAMYNPDLVLHLGVHSDDRCVRIETRSYGTGYWRDDIKSKTPQGYRCPLTDCLENDNIICCGIDCKQLLQAVKAKFTREDIEIQLSDDPGRYLCAYSYYISLRHNKDCCLFVHIPEFDESCTEELITKVVKQIILSSMLQVLKAREASLCNEKDRKHLKSDL